MTTLSGTGPSGPTRAQKWGMAIVIAIALLLALVTAIAIRSDGQAAPSAPPAAAPAAPATVSPKIFTPSADHAKDLKIAQLQAQVAQQQYQSALSQFQSAIAALNAAGAQVISEEGWPKDVQFDANSLTFTEAARAESAKAARPVRPAEKSAEPGK